MILLFMINSCNCLDSQENRKAGGTMKIRNMLVKIWAYGGMLITASLVLFLFIYVFYKGSGTISWEFLF